MGPEQLAAKIKQQDEEIITYLRTIGELRNDLHKLNIEIDNYRAAVKGFEASFRIKNPRVSYEPGYKAKLPNGRKAVIEAVVIVPGAIKYRVAWWDSSGRVTAVVDSSEVEDGDLLPPRLIERVEPHEHDQLGGPRYEC